MDRMKEIYADKLSLIHFTAGMVRFDFASFQSGEDGGAPVSREFLRVVMPLQGFMESFDSAQRLIQRLADAGIFQKIESKAAVNAPEKAPAKKAPAKRGPKAKTAAAEGGEKAPARKRKKQ